MKSLLLLLTSGCSASSWAAGVLSRDLGVCFSHEPNAGTVDEKTGKPFWEVPLFKPYIRNLATSRISPLQFRNMIEGYHRDYGCTSATIGLKAPRLSTVHFRKIKAIGARWTVHLVRPEEQAVPSRVRYFGGTERSQGMFYRTLEHNLNAVEADLTIPVDSRAKLEDSYLAAMVRGLMES